MTESEFLIAQALESSARALYEKDRARISATVSWEQASEETRTEYEAVARTMLLNLLENAEVTRHWRVVLEKFAGPVVWGTFGVDEAMARRQLEHLRREGSGNARLQYKLLAEYHGWKIESPWGTDE